MICFSPNIFLSFSCPSGMLVAGDSPNSRKRVNLGQLHGVYVLHCTREMSDWLIGDSITKRCQTISGMFKMRVLNSCDVIVLTADVLVLYLQICGNITHVASIWVWISANP